MPKYRSIVTVTSASSTYDLTVLSTVKTELGLTSSDYDDRLRLWIKQASSMVASYCDRVFALETVSEQYRLFREESYLLLSRYPAQSITSITEDDETLESDEYELDASAGLVYRLDGEDNRVNWWTEKVTIVYIAGYALLDDLPYDIERACLELVKYFYFSHGRDPYVRGETVEGVGRIDYGFGGVSSSSSSAGMPVNVMALLDPYRSINA